MLESYLRAIAAAKPGRMEVQPVKAG
ncbi:hypothetical protein MPLSOD_300004 [Mesorhizobium sp. SOD10]|nr:hypothetical protein MPLSOD_300004 [Mesorhizobium sp. SOD10]